MKTLIARTRLSAHKIRFHRNNWGDPSNELEQRLILPILGLSLFSVESVRLMIRFRPHQNLANAVNVVCNCKRVENSSESNSHFGLLIGVSGILKNWN